MNVFIEISEEWITLNSRHTHTLHIYHLDHSYRRVLPIYQIPVLMKEQSKSDSPMSKPKLSHLAFTLKITILWSQRCVLYHLLKHDFLVLFKGLMEDGFSERDSSSRCIKDVRAARISL